MALGIRQQREVCDALNRIGDYCLKQVLKVPEHAPDGLWPKELAVVFEAKAQSGGLFFSFECEIELGLRIRYFQRRQSQPFNRQVRSRAVLERKHCLEQRRA